MSLEKQLLANIRRNQSRQQTFDRMQERLIFANSGGLWQATPEFISFVHALDTDHAVVADVDNTPRLVNPRELLELARSQYQYAMNAWLAEWKKYE